MAERQVENVFIEVRYAGGYGGGDDVWYSSGYGLGGIIYPLLCGGTLT
jgi:hypothetical protein